MNCDAFPPRLTVKQTYGRQNKNKHVRPSASPKVRRTVLVDNHPPSSPSNSVCLSSTSHIPHATGKSPGEVLRNESNQATLDEHFSRVVSSPRTKPQTPLTNSICLKSPQINITKLSPNTPRTIPNILKRVPDTVNTNQITLKKHVSPKKDKGAGTFAKSPQSLYKVNHLNKMLTPYIKIMPSEIQSQQLSSKNSVGLQCEIQPINKMKLVSSKNSVGLQCEIQPINKMKLISCKKSIGLQCEIHSITPSTYLQNQQVSSKKNVGLQCDMPPTVKISLSDHQNKQVCFKKTIGTQYEPQTSLLTAVANIPAATLQSPTKCDTDECHQGSAKYNQESDKCVPIVCNVSHKTEDMIIVKHCVGGVVYTGILMKESARDDAPNYGYFAEQLPSQHHKKIKSKLGLSFENLCDSENSDSESVKMKMKKVKNSELKAMRESILEPLPSGKPSSVSKMYTAQPGDIPKARANVPFKNTSNHNKNSINGLANFLKEASINNQTSENRQSSSCTQKSSNVAISPTPKLIKPEKDSLPCHKKMKTSDSGSVSYVAYVKKESVSSTNLKKSGCKFGEKFVCQKKSLMKSHSLSIESPKPSWIVHDTEQHKKERHRTTSSDDPNRDYKMRQKRTSATDNKFPIQQLIRQTSGSLGYIDLEWPIWCPRKLQLSIKRAKTAKPGRFKLERNGSKRRRTSSESSSCSRYEELDQKFTETNNPFGVGDVVIAKRMSAPGRPYWPAKVLSTTGLTVCLSFYNTPETMQVPKCNVEWYYDGCIAHKIKLNCDGGSQEWKEALTKAEDDAKSSIGVDSIVWGKYDDEWWPARVLQIDSKKKYIISWLDNDSIEPLPQSDIAPFLLSYNMLFDDTLVTDHENYQQVVKQANKQALLVLLDTKTAIEDKQS